MGESTGMQGRGSSYGMVGGVGTFVGCWCVMIAGPTLISFPLTRIQ